MLPDLPGWMWLAVAAIPVTAVGLMFLVYLWALRLQARMIAARKKMFDEYFAVRGSRCSDEDPDCERVEAGLVELLEGGPISAYWVAPADAGTFFEYGSVDRHGYGYLERSPLAGLETTVKVFPKTKLNFEDDAIFRFGRQIGVGWASPDFRRRFGVVARDPAVASRVVTSGLQRLLLELPEVSRLDRELIEIAVNNNYLAVLGRKGDWRAKRGDKLPDLENHLRLALRIRDELRR